MSQHHRLLAAAVAATALAVTAVQAADNFPSRPMQLVIPFAAGGPTDIVGRIMGAKMGEILGQTFMVEDRSGAGGNIGADFVAKATPDGYTLLMATVSTNAINPGLYKHMPYDAVKDFAPVARVGVTPTLLMVQPFDTRDRRQKPGRSAQGQSGQVRLRLVRRRFDPASVRRGIQSDGRRARHRARALQRLGADGHRSDGRPDRRWRSTRRRPRCRWRCRARSTRSAPGCSSAFPPCRICRPWTSRA